MQGIMIFTTIAFVISIVLVLTNHFLNKEDKRIAKVIDLLPGYNCGACGFGGCADMALNIVNEGVDPKKCRPMNEDQYKNIMKYLENHGRK